MESDPSDEGWVYVPAPPDTESYTDLGTFTVEDETFAVRRRDNDGSVHYDWISGPNSGYGFSVFGGPRPIAREKHEADLRDFLAAIDPETGYL